MKNKIFKLLVFTFTVTLISACGGSSSGTKSDGEHKSSGSSNKSQIKVIKLEHAIEEMTLSNDGSIAYVADDITEERKIRIMDTSKFKEISAVDGIGSTVNGLTLSPDGNYLYVANESDGILILDVKDSKSPKKIGEWHAAGGDDDYMEAIAISKNGNIAYVANEYEGFYILDVSNPKTPVLLSRITPTSGYNRIVDVVISPDEKIAYLGNSADLGLVIVDIQDPRNPSIISETPNFDCVKMDISKDGKKLYLVKSRYGNNQNRKFQIVDITTPSAPSLISEILVKDKYGTDNIRDIVVSNDDTFAFLALYVGNVQIVDISDPKNPKQLPFEDKSGASKIELSKDGEDLYFWTSDVKVINKM